MSNTTLEAEPDRATVAEDPGGACRIVHSPDASAVGKTLPLADDDSVVTIGRDVAKRGTTIDDPRMSRVHARITWDGATNAFRIGDADSSNGTFHNGRRVATALLQDGDVLRLGDTLLVYERGSRPGFLTKHIARLAAAELTVLITGESGTGKELVARRIHEQSGRPGSFVAVNCAALPRELVASELFGHTRGAFSSASQARQGLFLAAQHGTLLLDEIGDLPLELQPALLRVLQEKTVRAVGSDRERPIDARVLAATHVDLEECTRRGAFRSDLHARLAQVVVRVPALRERRSDVLLLAGELATSSGRELRLSSDAAERLLLWHWPLNVRELQGIISSFFLLGSGPVLDCAHLREHHPALFGAPQVALEPARPLDTQGRREQLEHLLADNGGNVSAVARILGKPRAQIYRWLRRYGIDHR